jgi:hypothetical protein
MTVSAKVSRCLRQGLPLGRNYFLPDPFHVIMQLSHRPLSLLSGEMQYYRFAFSQTWLENASSRLTVEWNDEALFAVPERQRAQVPTIRAWPLCAEHNSNSTQLTLGPVSHESRTFDALKHHFLWLCPVPVALPSGVFPTGAYYMPCPSQSPWFDHSKNICWEGRKLWNFSLCNFPHHWPHLSPGTLPSTLSSDTLQGARPSFAPVQNSRSLYTCVGPPQIRKGKWLGA